MVCLCAKADRSTLKPFIVFKGAKREAVWLNNEFRGRCVVASSPDGWMNTELTLQFNMNILGLSSFGKRLLAWESFECHIQSAISADLKAKNFEELIVPGGCTKYMQAPDVSWNHSKPR